MATTLLYKWLQKWFSSASSKKETSANNYYENCLKLPLTIELVPYPCWGSNLRSVLAQCEWNELRTLAYTEARERCQACGTQIDSSFECHEVWHYDDVTKTQILGGLAALCWKCHRVKHIGQANASGFGDAAVEHLKKVNRMTAKDAESYIDDCFSLWNYRNSFWWDIDVSWIATQGMGVPNVPKKRENTRLEPLRVNSVVGSETYSKLGLTQPKEFWPHLAQSCPACSPAALEFILPLQRALENDPLTAQTIVTEFVEKHILLDDLYVQVNVLLPNPAGAHLDEDHKCLGLCQAHLLTSLLPIEHGGRFSAVSEYGLALLKSVCPQTYPSCPGQYNVSDGLLARWLTRPQVEHVWKQNAGLTPNLLFETKAGSSYVKATLVNSH